MRIILLSLFSLCCIPLLSNAQVIGPVEKLPEIFNGYRIDERLDYTGKNLFEYINGGAEMYLSYGLVGMKGCKYLSGDGDQIAIEIYEMTNSKNAYGVFTQSRDKEEYDYGQGSQSFDDFILFWKDRYFVIINTQKPSARSTSVIRDLASLIDRSIPEKGEIPDIIKKLPQQNLQSAGFLYFHHYIWLNSYYFIADHNIISIGAETDAVLAKYGDAQSRSYLLLVEYPDPDAAKSACTQLKQQYVPEAGTGDKAIRLEDGSWFTIWQKGNMLGAIFNGTSKESIEQLYHNTIINM